MVVAGTAPGSITELPGRNDTEKPKLSLLLKRFSTSAAARLNVLCPEMNSGNGGVGNVLG